MQALTYTHYGSADVLQLNEVAMPNVGQDEIRVRIYAATVNRTDDATIKAKPFFMRLVTGLIRPRKQIPGSAFAGVVESVGENITSFKVGERVFGFNDNGAMSQAEYTCSKQANLESIPDGVSFAQAAASSEGAHYAYNFINKLALKPGQSVLVNGATGAIGSAAVQLLKYFGLKVTAVCSTEGIARVQSMAADHVIDYKEQDFTQCKECYDVVFDTVGKSAFFKCLKVLNHGGVYMSSELGFLAQNMYLPLVTAILKPLFGMKKVIFPVPVNIKASLVLIKKLLAEGKYQPLIDRDYPLGDIVEAYRYVEKGRKKGNVVITVVKESH